MSIAKEIVSVILGGGAGSRLYPLTASRSKPAVPIAGKYRLVDIPISNCMNSGINRMFVLTQFNSASLNRHIKNTYHFSAFSSAFVDILAAEQTPDNPTWYQGTADAVRQSLRHIAPFDSDYILILSGDQLYQMDFQEMLDNHKATGADISIATIPVGDREAPEFGILKKDESGLITSFIEKPKKEILGEWESDHHEAPEEPWTLEWMNLLSKMEFALEVIRLDDIHPRADLMSVEDFQISLKERADEREHAMLRGVSIEPLLVNRNGFELMDGYTRYTVLKRYQQKEVYAYIGSLL